MSARYTIGVSKSYPFSQADNLFSLILSPFLKLFSFASTRTPCFLPPGNRAFLLIYRQTAVWTISRFLCRSFTAYSNFVHTFGIERQYTVLVSEGEPQIPHWRHPIFSFLFFPFFQFVLLTESTVVSFPRETAVLSRFWHLSINKPVRFLRKVSF